MGKPLVYSASQKIEHARCERFFFFRRVVKLPTLSSSAQMFGTVFASVMERHLRGEEPFPLQWDDGLTPVEADMARRFLAKAKEVVKIPGLQAVEAEFYLDVLPEEEVCRHCAARRSSGDVCFGREHEWVTLPAVRLVGYPDVVHSEGIDDHKTTKSLRWAKSSDELRQDLQLGVYAKAWLEARRSQGLLDPSHVRLRHHYYVKESGEVATREALPPLTPAEIDLFWQERVAQAQRMRWLMFKNKVDSDLHADETWSKVPASGSLEDAKYKRPGTPCGAFGGCPFAEICGDGGDRPSLYRKRITRIMENEERKARGLPPLVEEEIVMSNIFAGLLPPTNGAAAPPQAPAAAAPQTPVAGPFANLLGAPVHVPVATVAQAPATAVMAGAGPFAAMLGLVPGAPVNAATQTVATPVASASVSNPFAAMLGLGASAPAQAPAAQAAPSQPVKKLREIWPGCPPWARNDCTACIHKGPDGIERNTGLNTRGSPCQICTHMNMSEGRITARMFEYGLMNGMFFWEIKSDHVERAEKECDGRAGGEIAFPVGGGQAPAVQQAVQQAVAPTSTPVQALVAAPTPPVATLAPPVMTASVPVVQHTQAVVVQASAAEKPARNRTKKGFTLLRKCLPAGGGRFVRLDELFAKYASLLAEQHGKNPSAGYWELDPKTRQSQLGSIVPQIVEAEKVGSGYVVATNLVLPDVEAFYAAFALHADEEIVGL